MDEERIATELLGSLSIPKSKVSAWIWQGDTEPWIVVRLDPSIWHRRDEIPATFGGLRVEVQRREKVRALSR